MRRTLSSFVPLLLVAFAFAGSAIAAEPGTLPLKKIVLFNSGVGFYEHRGQVNGNADVELRFSAEDVNDLLKSLVPQDLDGGQVSTITYGSQDPITKTLQSFAVDLTKNPTVADLLQQVRGERIELETSKMITGTLVGVERRRRAVKDEILEEDFINLLTDGGLTSVPLSGVQRIKLQNEKLDAELRQALGILALGHGNDKKTVSLKFLGEGKRNVRVGYIQEAPIWKTSYRLVLDDEGALLQGWAVVENTTDEDWNDVDLALVSGRPISFVMNLYQPLYIPRPMVEPELFASLRPQRYGQDMGAKEQEFAKRELGSDRSLALGDRRRETAGMPPAPAAAAASPMLRKSLDKLAGSAMEMQNGNRAADAKAQQAQAWAMVQSAAEANDVGELFQYEIAAPVTLGRQKSALLPIVAERVKGEKLSIYNASVHVKHPLNGLRLTNSTKLHLMQGPITVFDDDAYAGDAQIEDLPPGSERLVSYAMDLDVEVAPSGKQLPNQVVSVKLSRGMLTVTNRYEREQTYTVKNSGPQAKQVLIEQSLDPSWKLLAPEKPAEKTRDRYRFVVAAAPGKPSELKVREEQTVSNQIAITNLDANTFAVYLRAKVVSDGLRKAFEEVRTWQTKVETVQADLAARELEIRTIEQEQNRIRQNMNQLDRNSELYLRYVKKFSEQEDQVEQLRGAVKRLQMEVENGRRALQEFVANLTVE
jgi:hypothetical protein